ncbi:hypothetical protein [Azospirillum agricola]|uniref:hypothetical protein n=1 Tax=Azospirillum agricola TaxID=1720247 RepID=UPI000A0EFEF2|nr:hypothetical protein [Azospirillum agricola]MBP2228633.1 hypothetical protein [Azospirillum agricola]SMH33142.1 hypothetical protein SAMN02982994_0599 [Azospirillum lipoferum]
MLPFENATPTSGRWPVLATAAQMAQAQTLAGWITLLAEDRGLDERGVAAATGLDLEDARAILDGVVLMIPLPVLDRALRRLEGRPH